MNPKSITGIVVCGGQSSRMGRDKSMLVYYSQPQRYHIAELLQPFCKEVYISLNATQQDDNDKYKLIRDNSATFSDNGPITALLSSYESLPGQNLLFIGCDYPLLNTNEIASFLKSINKNTKAKTFFNKIENLYEPLLAYYSSDFNKDVLQYFGNGNNSLQKLLLHSNAEKYLPEDKNVLMSVDDEEGLKRMIVFIGKH